MKPAEVIRNVGIIAIVAVVWFFMGIAVMAMLIRMTVFGGYVADN